MSPHSVQGAVLDCGSKGKGDKDPREHRRKVNCEVQWGRKDM